MKKNLLIKFLIQFVVLVMVMSFSIPVFAAKPPPKPVSPPDIITTVDPITIDEGQTATFSVTASAKDPTKIIWSSTPEGLTLVNKVINKRANPPTSTANFSFYGAIAGTNQFTIEATNSGVSDQITVSITVNGTSPPPPPTEINYLILGDSIAAGTDNANIYNAIVQQINANSSMLSLLTDIQDLTANPENYLDGSDYRYTYQFKNYLETNGYTVNMTDLSVPGDLTADLLSKVRANLSAVQAADVITISIGGNDVLAAGANSGFSQIDTTQFTAISAAINSNLDATLSTIRANNQDAKIILMNLFNLYHPSEKSLTGDSLYMQTDSFLKPDGSWVGAVFNAMKDKYNLILADTYNMYATVNFETSSYSTAGTYAALPGFTNPPYLMPALSTFPARFINQATTEIKSPFNAWAAYLNDWNRLSTASYNITNFLPESNNVTIDLYTHFYNPNHYVFGHDAATSTLINMIKSKYGWFNWLLFGGTVLDNIEPFEKWRDVHCTALGHSLIAKAHIEAWEAATTP